MYVHTGPHRVGAKIGTATYQSEKMDRGRPQVDLAALQIIGPYLTLGLFSAHMFFAFSHGDEAIVLLYFFNHLIQATCLG